MGHLHDPLMDVLTLFLAAHEVNLSVKLVVEALALTEDALHATETTHIALKLFLALVSK